MPYRYNSRSTLSITKRDMFKQIKQRRKLDSIEVYSTAKFNQISDLDLEEIDYESYIWKRGDRFYKLAYEYYGESSYWWIIALFNNAPTEHHIKIGEEIFIPTEHRSIASLYGIE